MNITGGGTTNTITSVQKDNIVLEMAYYIDIDVQVLIPKRNEYGKKIRKLYEDGKIEEKRGNMTDLIPRWDDISNTITTALKDNIIMKKLMQEPIEARPKGKGWKWIPEEKCWIRLRKLTPRECFRLMGVRETDIDKIQYAVFPKKSLVPTRYGGTDKDANETVISDSQQYKLAGNSIVVDCMYGIFRKLFVDKENEQSELKLF